MLQKVEFNVHRLPMHAHEGGARSNTREEKENTTNIGRILRNGTVKGDYRKNSYKKEKKAS